MDLQTHPKSITAEFEAQVTAALMIQNNALIPIKIAVKLCGISRQEIYRRIQMGKFPDPALLRRKRQSKNISFYLKDLHAWIKNPRKYTNKEN